MPEPGVGESEVDHGTVLLAAVLLEFCVALDEGLKERESISNRGQRNTLKHTKYQCCDSNQ